MDEPRNREEGSSGLPSPCSDAKFSLHIPQNPRGYKLTTQMTWNASCTETGLTLPNALDTSRPTKRMAERSASSYGCSYMRKGRERGKGILSPPPWCTILTAGTSTPDKTPPTTDGEKLWWSFSLKAHTSGSPINMRQATIPPKFFVTYKQAE